jgi:hypothetical protein
MAVSAASQPATAPATTQATRPILTSGDPNVDRILERLERRGDGVNSLTAGLEAEFHDLVADDKQTKIGKLWFRRDKPNPKFKVVYEKSLFEDVEVVDPREYLFDGQWLTEKHDKSKTFVHREIVGQGERIDVFRIGKGPFPLPFGQKKADILEHFDVTLVPRSPKDPPGTEHLRLIPHKDSPMAEKYVELHFYIDPKIDLPVRVVSHQRRPGSTEVDEIVTVTFKDIRINPPVPDGILSIEKPTGKEWHISEEPLPSKPFPPDSRQ